MPRNRKQKTAREMQRYVESCRARAEAEAFVRAHNSLKTPVRTRRQSRKDAAAADPSRPNGGCALTPADQVQAVVGVGLRDHERRLRTLEKMTPPRVTALSVRDGDQEITYYFARPSIFSRAFLAVRDWINAGPPPVRTYNAEHPMPRGKSPTWEDGQ